MLPVPGVSVVSSHPSTPRVPAISRGGRFLSALTESPLLTLRALICPSVAISSSVSPAAKYGGSVDALASDIGNTAIVRMDASAVPRFDPVVRVQTIKATIASSNAATTEANATPKRRRDVRTGWGAVAGNGAAPSESRNADSKSPTL